MKCAAIVAGVLLFGAGIADAAGPPLATFFAAAPFALDADRLVEYCDKALKGLARAKTPEEEQKVLADLLDAGVQALVGPGADVNATAENARGDRPRRVVPTTKLFGIECPDCPLMDVFPACAARRMEQKP